MEFGIHATELLSVGRLCYCQLPTHILTTPGLTKDLEHRKGGNLLRAQENVQERENHATELLGRPIYWQPRILTRQIE